LIYSYLSVFLRTTSLPLYVSSFIIVRDSSGLKAENSRPREKQLAEQAAKGGAAAEAGA
jgi:hypothetical protein